MLSVTPEKPNPNQGTKPFLSQIFAEIKEELRETAETHVIQDCSRKYSDLISMGFFKIFNNDNNMGYKERDNDDKIPQRERISVMGAILSNIDGRSFKTTIAVVDKYGELQAHNEFLHILPPRKSRPRDGGPPVLRPGEEEE